jgi:hypothetical protein
VLCAPWVTTGRVTRSGYAFVRAVRLAGAGDTVLDHMLMAAALALPLLAGLACAAAVLGWARAAAAVSGLAGLVLVTLATCAMRQPAGPALAGPWSGLLLGLAALALAVVYTRKGTPAHA